jgi:hypothetical protein
MEDRMKSRKTTTRSRLVLVLSLGIFALALLAPAANADVTIHHIKVQVDGVTYCDSGTVGCSVTEAWNFGASGLTLSGASGQTLVLTQSGAIAMPNVLSGVGPNFDTSDKAGPAGAFSCSTSTLCPVSIFIDFGTGFPATPQYGPNGSNPLNHFGADTAATVNGPEGVQYTTVLTVANSYQLNLGYADTSHPGIAPSPSMACASPTGGAQCVPNPWIDSTHGASAATFSFGTPLSTTTVPGFPAVCDSYCFDAGVIMIKALPPPAVGTCPLTQGFWKNHPNAWPVSSLTIGGVPYSKQTLIGILETPPSGGNAVLILGHQLIAALLNMDNGAIVPANVATAIAQANSLIASVPGGLNGFVDASSTLGQQMTALGDILDGFNSGNFTGTCTGPS